MSDFPVFTGFAHNYVRVGEGSARPLEIRVHDGGWTPPRNMDYPLPQHAGSYDSTEPTESVRDAVRWVRDYVARVERLRNERERAKHLASDVVFYEWLTLPPADDRTIAEYFDDKFVVIHGELFRRWFS